MIVNVNNLPIRIKYKESNNNGIYVVLMYYNEFFLGRYNNPLLNSDNINEKLSNYLKNIMSPEDVVEKAKKSAVLPNTLIKSLEYAVTKEKSNRMLTQLMINFDVTQDGTILMLEKAATTLDVTYEDLIRATDYFYKDQKPNRIGNAFAEIRVVNVLSDNNYVDIELSSSKNGMKNADIYAYYMNEKFAIDVAHSHNYYLEDEIRKFNEQQDYIDFIENIYKSKYEQLNSSALRCDCNCKMLAIVIDEINALFALNYEDNIEEYFLNVFNKLSFKDDCGITLVFNSHSFVFNPA